MSTRRSRKVKNLEEALESIFSQDESNEDSKDVIHENQKSAITPSRTGKFLEVSTPKASDAVLQDLQQTPRRSSRKSIRPAQDYEEIVKHSLRYSTRSANKSLLAEVENVETNDNDVKPKWTPAKVGRFSEKRSRKSKRAIKGKMQCIEKTEPLVDDTVFNKNETEVINISENTEKVIDTVQALNVTLENINLLNTSIKIVKTSDSVQKDQVDEIVLQSSNIQLESIKNDENELKVSDAEKEEESSPSVQLIHEDSEITHESTDKSEPEEICIMYEKNMCNLEDKSEDENNIQSKSSTNKSSEDEDNFGCYLKSKMLNISDLGLNPIKQDEEIDRINLEHQCKTPLLEIEEMPSLLICDDEEELEQPKETKNLNETFDADKNEDIEKCLKQNMDVMETLQLSDEDCNTPKKATRTLLTDGKVQNKKESNVRTKALSTTRAKTTILPATSKSTNKANNCTPKQTRKINRLPTPYRNRVFNFIDESKENIERTPGKAMPNSSTISLTTLEPKEIVLKGIRKRSLSVTINEQQNSSLLAGSVSKQKQNRIVSFYSPANQTTIIDDLDLVIAKSVKKKKFQENDSTKKYVTTRRKRSISLDDSVMSATLASKLPRPVPVQNKLQSASLSKTLKRTKLPNFAAIHEKHFNKMENLVEHVNRKQERSKNLINSATKLFPASSQKNISLNKNRDNITAVKSRALKKIDLNPKPQKIEKADLIIKSAAPKKPAFNLSTSINVKPTTSASNFAEKANTSHLNNEKKVTSRLERHKELFKGRNPSAREAARKNETILRGVRSNRRFELQMQHRKNLEQ